jgi:uncharacterized membrane protein HdeD (DUF308 family)
MAKKEAVEVSVPKWWSFLLRGLAAIIFGVMVLAWPDSTRKVLVLVFGIFVIVAGVAALAAAVTEARNDENFFLSLIVGIVCLVIGIMVLAWPEMGLTTIRYLIAAWLIIYGFMIIMSGFEAPKGDSGLKWILVLTGAASIVIGIILIAVPGLAQWTIILIVGIYAIAHGIMLCVASTRIRRLYRQLGLT